MRRNRNISRPTSLRHGARLAAGVSAVLMVQPALAQDAAEEEEIQLDTLEIKDHTADSNPYTVEGAPYKARISGDVRRTRPLAETPATITVLTETQIEESGATDLKNIVAMQPGVTIGTGENGNAFGDRYIIRGQEARSDVFVDGLRDPGMTTRESFAVDQVEITKGPSSTFAGRGATGGAVNSITKQASTDYNFNRVDLGAGTDEYYRATLDSNWRLSDDVAVRANLLYSQQDVPDRDPADRERWGAALSGTAHLSDSVRVLLDYYHMTANDKPDLGTYVRPSTADGYGATLDDLPAVTQDEDFLESEVDTFTGRVFIEPGNGLKIVNLTRYGETSNGYVTTGARGGEGGASVGLSTHQGWQEVEYFANQFNVMGEFETGSLLHNLIAGSEYSDMKVTNGTYGYSVNGDTNCMVSGRGGSRPGYCVTDETGALIVDDISGVLDREITRGDADSNWHVETLSFYAMDTIDLTPWLSINGGVRLDAFDYSNVVASGGTLTNYSYSDELWNGNAGVSVSPIEELMLYASWGTAKNINGGESDLGSNCGYGGLCITDDTDLGSGRPESTTNYELGAKWDLFGHRLLLSAAAFQLTKDDVYEIASGSSGYDQEGNINTGKHRIRGIELGVVGNITERLSGQIGFSIMDAEVLESYDPASIGLTLANFADTQATGQIRYQATDALAFGGTVTYKSAMYAGQPDSAASYSAEAGRYSYRVPSYVTGDVFVSYKINQNYSARINVTNVTDEDYYTAAYRSGAFLYKGDERRTTLTLTGKF